CPALSVGYNARGAVIEPAEAELFRRAIELLARLLLLPDPKTGKPPFNTRVNVEAIFDEIESKDPRLVAFIKREGRASKTSPPSKKEDPSKRAVSDGDSKNDGETSGRQSGPQAGAAGTETEQPTKPGPLPKLPKFFEDLEC